MEISFHGAAQTVTGSKHLITLWDNEKILLDFGMFQGLGKDTLQMNLDYEFDPRGIDHVFLSHAHVDHSGLLPKLVKDGYEGKIYCTPATYDLCKIMLMDSAYIQEADIRFVNKRRRAKGKEPIEPMYKQADVEKCLDQFVEVRPNSSQKINDHLTVEFIPNGHILGSAAIHLTVREVNETTRILYTGDIGRYDSFLLRDPEPTPQADIIVCESTYGDRLHDKEEDVAQEILDVVMQTVKVNKGKLIIPAFSLGRTQEIVYLLNRMDLYGLLPDIKIYVDSPLAVNATAITRAHVHLLNNTVQEFAEARSDPFGFDKLTYITDKRDSQKLNLSDEPCIIISAAGMAEAGRVKHHIMHGIENPRNTIMIVGYAEPLSLAGKLRGGSSMVKIFSKEFKVKARVHVVDSISAHGDYKEMIQYLSCQNHEEVRKIFLVHGDLGAQQHFKEKLREAGFNNVYIPERFERYPEVQR